MPDSMTYSTKQLRVLCVHGVSFVGGVTRMIRDGVPELAKLPGVQIKVTDLYGRSDLFDPERIEIDPAIGMQGRGYISTAKGFRRWIDMALQSVRYVRIVFRLSAALKRYDVLYIHSNKELVLAAIAMRLSRSRVALVWHCHGVGEAVSKKRLRRLGNRCHRIITDSNSVRDRLLNIGVKGKNICPVYNAIDLRSIQDAVAWSPEEESSAGDRKLVILVPSATMYFDKGIHLAVEALASLPDSCVLWITGNDASGANRAYVEELRATVQRFCVADRVEFLGFRPDIYSVMKAADVVCVPSLCPEGFGLVAAEGMALGKVVVVSNRGGLPEVVDHGRMGLVFDPVMPSDLAEKLNLVAADPTRMSALAAEAAIYAAKAYSYTRWAEEVKNELLIAIEARRSLLGKEAGPDRGFRSMDREAKG